MESKKSQLSASVSQQQETAPNPNRLKVTVCSALYTMHRYLKVFADRILLINMKRITLFWIVFSYFLYSE